MIEYQEPTLLGMDIGTIAFVCIIFAVFSMLILSAGGASILGLIGFSGAFLSLSFFAGAAIFHTIEMDKTLTRIEDSYGVVLNFDGKQIDIPEPGESILYEDTLYEGETIPVVSLARSEDDMLTLYVPTESSGGAEVPEWVELAPAED